MPKHRCAALLTAVFFTMPKHRCAALLTFHDAETPLRNTDDFLPDAETPLFSTFHFLPFPKTSQPPILIPETIPSSTCFVLPFPVAETPATFHQYSSC
jgi:hypothetical protein